MKETPLLNRLQNMKLLCESWAENLSTKDKRYIMKGRKFILAGVVLGGMFMADDVVALTISPSWKYAANEMYANGEVSTLYAGQYSPLAKKGDVFITFCLERNENVFAATYDVAISDAAKPGGRGGVEGADPISQGTALLYSLYARGMLPEFSYNNAYNRFWDAAALQQTIWYLENEVSRISPANKFYHYVLEIFGNVTTARTTTNIEQYGVHVMNLTKNGKTAQDFLVYIPHVQVPVPDGGWTGAMLGFGVVCLSVVGRRLRDAHCEGR